MDLKRKCIVASAVLAVLAVSVLLLTLFIRVPHLVLTNARSGAVVFSTRVSEGEEFRISYIHSVNISPVTEIFLVRDGMVILEAIEFYTFGAGMPTAPEYGQTMLHLADGRMRIEGYDRIMRNLTFLVSGLTEHTLLVGGQEIPLLTLDSAGSPISFEIIRQNMWRSFN